MLLPTYFHAEGSFLKCL